MGNVDVLSKCIRALEAGRIDDAVAIVSLLDGDEGCHVKRQAESAIASGDIELALMLLNSYRSGID